MIKKKLRQKCSAFFVYIVSITDAVANCSKHCVEVTDRAWKASLKAICFSSLEEYFWRKLCFLYLPPRQSLRLLSNLVGMSYNMLLYQLLQPICHQVTFAYFQPQKLPQVFRAMRRWTMKSSFYEILISISLVYNFSLTYCTNSFHHDLRKKGRPIFSAESMEIVGGFLSR